MKKFILTLLIISNILLIAQENYSNAIMPKLPNAFDMFIGREENNKLPQYIKNDLIRDDYKRKLPDLNNTNLSFFQKYPLEFHLTSTFSYAAHTNTFNMRDTFVSLGQTFHNDYIAFTGFITAFGYFDTHEPATNYEYIKGNAGLYDGGAQVIFIDRILVSARGRATFDINTTTFMLMPHYYDTTLNPANIDTPNYYLPQVLNGPGIRVGFIGNHYEIAYSQGDFRHSIPKAFLFRFNIPNIELRLLYEHENRKAPKDYHITLFESLIQASATLRFPFLSETIWLNAIAEYTWRENDAHYIRLEQGFEWYMLNIALREIVHIEKDKNAKAYLEYAIFGKFAAGPAEFAIGFQGSTDGRYYIAGHVKL
ncbi:hypothetical protein EPJ64_03350 [Brachyspira aalborgi]|uniref:hypothetical protein n=1 Tax=Brachyspira aalborgi TaxID=29522 RepID=UPI0011C9175A|nr:hypothetical protein [Brachyspira aalborgi]TXJ16433.1 hypothetical protein EPJ77_03355 [Brachyspira aalborgi]TXJ22014.1 hypothetical protein EPJ64_03350 [Brachyspira aalborgi]